MAVVRDRRGRPRSPCRASRRQPFRRRSSSARRSQRRPRVTEGFVTVAMSPQGTYIAYAVCLGSNNLARLHLRRLSESAARALPGTEGGANPFFSPDGEWLGFFAAGKLKKVPVAGGAAQVLADAPSGRGAFVGDRRHDRLCPHSRGRSCTVSRPMVVRSPGLTTVEADGAVAPLAARAPRRAHRSLYHPRCRQALRRCSHRRRADRRRRAADHY